MSVLDLFSDETAELKKKNKTKVFTNGLHEASDWLESDQEFPVYGEEEAVSEKPTERKKRLTNSMKAWLKTSEDVEEVPKPADKKRKSKESEVESKAVAPPAAKKSKKAADVEVDEILSSSDEDAPYKAPYPDPKKARRYRIMRKLGLSPPDGSLFKTTNTASS